MESHFTSQTLAEIFRDLYLGERSGVLALQREGVEKRIHFDRGLIHYAESNEENEALAERLIRDRRISTGALDEAERDIQSQAELAVSLLNRGLIGKESLALTVWGIVNTVVRSVFQWDSGTATFHEDERIATSFHSDVLRTFEVILNGVFGMSDFGAIGEAMRGLDNKLQVRHPGPLPLERLALSPSHGYALSRVDGSSTMAEVLSLLPEQEEELAARFLYALLVMGVLIYDPPVSDGPFRVASIVRDHADRKALERTQEQTIRQAYERMRNQSPYEILGVTPSATREAVSQAYEEAKALFSRDRLEPRIKEQYRSELAVIESRLVESYLRLTQADEPERERTPMPPPSETTAGGGVDDLLVRVEMDKTRSKLAMEEAVKVADSYLTKARAAQREGDFHNAIQYGKLAISYAPDDARLFHLLAECQVRNPGARWQHQAEQNFTKATELDPWKAEYWISLGRFYKKRGLKIRARKQFEEALKVVPEHEEANRELIALD